MVLRIDLYLPINVSTVDATEYQRE